MKSIVAITTSRPPTGVLSPLLLLMGVRTMVKLADFPCTICHDEGCAECDCEPTATRHPPTSAAPELVTIKILPDQTELVTRENALQREAVLVARIADIEAQLAAAKKEIAKREEHREKLMLGYRGQEKRAKTAEAEADKLRGLLGEARKSLKRAPFDLFRAIDKALAGKEQNHDK